MSATPDTAAGAGASRRLPARTDGRDPFPRATLADYVRRTFGAAADPVLNPTDIAWVGSILTAAELELWSAQSSYDRVHSARVARRVERRLAGTAWAGDPRWPAAALLHDVGKPSGLRFAERIAANVLRRAIGLSRARAWAREAPGIRRRFGAYLAHGEIGAAMIRAAGGREELAAWTELHQTHPGGAAPGVPAAVVAALLASDRA